MLAQTDPCYHREGPGVWLWPEPMHLTWKGDRFPHVRYAADPRHDTLNTHPKPRMHEGTVLPEVQLPVVRVFREIFLSNP